MLLDVFMIPLLARDNSKWKAGKPGSVETRPSYVDSCESLVDVVQCGNTISPILWTNTNDHNHRCFSFYSKDLGSMVFWPRTNPVHGCWECFCRVTTVEVEWVVLESTILYVTILCELIQFQYVKMGLIPIHGKCLFGRCDCGVFLGVWVDWHYHIWSIS